MPVILDPELKALMDNDESVAVLWQDKENKQTALLAKATDQDIVGFRGNIPIQFYWELGRFACGSVLRFHLTIFDQPENPYRFETFINVAAPEQLACVMKLLAQETLLIHFFGRQTEYIFTKEINYPVMQRGELGELVRQALQDQEKLVEDWDFNQAKTIFQAHHPL